ncbi:DEAD/DEAH box helicase [Micromonospora sp. NPDC047620]|uniref:DEAD/DEAH box helicase n=1 Tax=Micromonospora sp. NPDC047620 TaxID=3364251 RepID=UPI0037227DA4
MQIPIAWLDDECVERNPEAFARCDAEKATIRFTVLRHVLDKAGVSAHEVEADLMDGMTLTHREQGSVFIATGSQFRLIVVPSTGRDGSTEIAKVVDVQFSIVARRNLLVRPDSVTLERPQRDDAPCDLPDLVEKFARARSILRRRESIRGTSRRRLAKAKRKPPGRSFRRDAKRELATISALLQVLRLRAATTAEISDEGVVAGSHVGNAVVQVQANSRLFDHARVTLTLGDQVTLRCRVDEAGSNKDRGVLLLRLPRSVVLERGLNVTVEAVPRFSMLANAAAVRRFTAENIDGSWNDLALLLLRPEGLANIQRTEIGQFHLECGAGPDEFRFNDEQREAVAGAVNAPHAFLIKGPPGTGKTSVITESVLQLVERGERVLLVAPMHVALDEVLQRLSNEPSIFPIRIAWDESRVRGDLQRFMPEHLSATYLRRARTIDQSRAKEWRDEIDELVSLREAITEFRLYRSQRSLFERTLADGTGALERLEREYESQVSEMNKSESSDVKTVRESEESLERLRSELADVERRGTRPAGPGVMAQLSEIGELRTKSERLERLIQGTESRIEAIFLRQAERSEQLMEGAARYADERERLAEQYMRAQDQLAEARVREVLAADHLVHLVGHEISSIADHAWEAREQELADRAAVLKKFIELEARWFEASGQTQGKSRAESRDEFQLQIRQSANVLCATPGGAASLDDVDFDTLIVDEASRVIDLEFLIGANQSKRWIIVGDEHQLPPYLDPKDELHFLALAAIHLAKAGSAIDLEEAVSRLATQWYEDDETREFRRDSVLAATEELRKSPNWSVHEKTFDDLLRLIGRKKKSPEQQVIRLVRKHLTKSLFERCITTVPDGLVAKLNTQRRMIEPIASLVNEPIYGGGLLSPPPGATGPQPFVLPAFGAPVVFMDTAAHQRAYDEFDDGGFTNALEVDWVWRVCSNIERELQATNETLSVSVLTFYKKQARLIRDRIEYPHSPAFARVGFDVVGVIDSIQGQQSDLVIVSFCRAKQGRPGPNYGRWLQDTRRLNVALTRARRGLIMIGHRPTLEGLRSVPEATKFYRHLFSTLESRKDVMTIVKDT